jgi:hypothetical protein
MNDAIIREIKQRARLFADDNLIDPDPRDYLMIENAMLIGSSIALENHPDPIGEDDTALRMLFHPKLDGTRCNFDFNSVRMHPPVGR